MAKKPVKTISHSKDKEHISKNVPTDMVRAPERFALLNHLVMRDLNNNKNVTTTIYKYTKDQIVTFLNNPQKNEKQIRQAVNYIYSVSTHFRRLIEYFARLSDLCYVVSPYRIDPETVNQKSIKRNYRRVLNTMAAMSPKTQFPKILTVCLREDTFFGTIWSTTDNITIQQLPSDYCAISTIEGNVPNVSFDFSYFTSKEDYLDYYPPEFSTKYNLYKGDRQGHRWQELDAPNSFAVKCNNDILNYSIPPFAGLLRELFDLEDYRALKLSKTALENYAMIVMTLGMDDEGNWLIDYDKAVQFWKNLDAVLPEEVGSILTPMPLNKISFEKANTGDTDTVAEAEKHIFTAAGVPSLLFSNDKASANALLLSIKADQSLTFGIVKSIQDVVNRYIQAQSYGKNFHVEFLDVSPYNRKEMADQYLKAATYGMPTISMYAATVGLEQAELDSMSFLETKILGLQDIFRPLLNSAQISSDDDDTTTTAEPLDTGGRTEKEDDELTEEGERSREEA